MVCGRRFYEGQGIILSISSKRLYFHSKSCAYKFLKNIIENISSDCIGDSIDIVIKNFREKIESKSKETQKKI